MKWIACVLATLALPASVSAQTHPCDLTPPTTFQVRRSEQVRIGFCHDQKEDDGTPIPLGQLHGYLINADSGALLRDLGMLAPITGASSRGDYYFESAVMTFAADVRLNLAVEYNSQQALAATPILVDVRGGPKAPSGLRIVISQ